MSEKDFDSLFTKINEVDISFFNFDCEKELEEYNIECDKYKEKIYNDFNNNLEKIKKLTRRIETKKERRRLINSDPVYSSLFINFKKELEMCKSYDKLIEIYEKYNCTHIYNETNLNFTKFRLLFENKKNKYLEEYNEKLNILYDKRQELKDGLKILKFDFGKDYGSAKIEEEIAKYSLVIKEISCLCSFNSALSHFRSYTKIPYSNQKSIDSLLMLTRNPYEIKDGKEVLKYVISKDLKIDSRVFYVLDIVYYIRPILPFEHIINN